MMNVERRAVGQFLPHDASRGHVTGQSLFLDDLPTQAGELVVGVVGSTVACGRIVSIDLAEAAEIPGVVRLFTWRDIPGHNQFGPIVAGECLLATESVSYIGEPIVVIAAETTEALAAAKRVIHIEIESETPILTIAAARNAQAFLGAEHRIERGDVVAALLAAPHRLRGTLEIGGQEHLYLETQGAVAYPGEDGQIVVHSSTQNPTEIQHVVAHLLGKGQHEIVGVCRRMGGGFGGKETQAAPPTMFAALVTHHTRHPARVVFEDGFVFDRGEPANGDRRLSFGELAHRAHRERIDLGQRSFYATPGLDRNRPFFYYTTGGAAVEVEIDRLTGEMRVVQADILMDIGRSINPAIDRGQVVGGFVQGMGWVTTEDLRHDGETGALLSAMPSRYKVPTIADIPPVFSVAFVEDAENPVNVASSKAVGEPPLLLGIAAWTAAKHALSFATSGMPELTLPATGEAIMRCLSQPGEPAKP